MRVSEYLDTKNVRALAESHFKAIQEAKLAGVNHYQLEIDHSRVVSEIMIAFGDEVKAILFQSNYLQEMSALNQHELHQTVVKAQQEEKANSLQSIFAGLLVLAFVAIIFVLNAAMKK